MSVSTTARPATARASSASPHISRYRYTQYRARPDLTELYNVSESGADGGSFAVERVNLAVGHPELLSSMRRRFDRRHACSGAGSPLLRKAAASREPAPAQWSREPYAEQGRRSLRSL